MDVPTNLHLCQSMQNSETLQNPRAISQTLQGSVRMLKVKVHDSIIRKRLKKFGNLHRLPGDGLFFKRT